VSRKQKDKDKPVSDGLVEARIRASLGHSKYGYPKYKPARRLKCGECKKTWKFSDALNFSTCPACKKGRLS